MFDLGWSELLVIGVVALIVVGPKDLPVMFRTLGKFTAQLRAMARDFTRAMEEAANESGVKEVSKDLRNLTNPRAMGVDALKKATDLKDLDFDPFGEDDEIADEAAATPARPKGTAAQKPVETAAAQAPGEPASVPSEQAAAGGAASADDAETSKA